MSNPRERAEGEQEDSSGRSWEEKKGGRERAGEDSRLTAEGEQGESKGRAGASSAARATAGGGRRAADGRIGLGAP